MIQNSDTPYCRDEIDGKYIYKSYCKLIGVNTHNEKAKHGGRWAVVVVLVMQVGGARGGALCDMDSSIGRTYDVIVWFIFRKG